MLLNDNAIRALCALGMIAPYEAEQVRKYEGWIDSGISERMARELGYGRPVVSYGTSSFGYDLRLAVDGFRVFSPHRAREIDPKSFDGASVIETPIHQAEDGSRYYLIPPHSYALGVTVEMFAMPADVLGVCLGKSTYARCGLIVNTTPLEPGWRGRLVLEMANTAPLPVRVYVNEGIAQCLFFRGEMPAISYADRAGKYQDQQGLTLARV